MQGICAVCRKWGAIAVDNPYFEQTQTIRRICKKCHERLNVEKIKQVIGKIGRNL